MPTDVVERADFVLSIAYDDETFFSVVEKEKIAGARNARRVIGEQPLRVTQEAQIVGEYVWVAVEALRKAAAVNVVHRAFRQC
jgi:hypothetical protein